MKEKKYQERLDRFRITAEHNEPDHVPVLHVAETWNLSYAGVKATDVEDNAQLEFESFCKPLEKIYCDGVTTSCLTREVNMYNQLGGGAYFYSEDGVTIQHKEYVFMKDSEYGAFTASPMDFSVNTIFGRKYPELTKNYPENLNALKKSLQAYIQYIERLIGSAQYHKENHGMPVLVGGVGQAPFDIIMDYYRGFKGIMTDLRRRPEEIIEAAESMVPLILSSIMQGKPSLESYPMVFFPLHAPTFLSAKQFEKLYWPTFRSVLYQVAEKGGKALIALEGDWSHLYEFVNDFPKDFAVTLIEKDDIVEAKKKIGDTVTLAGGIGLGMLRSAKKEECIDHVKRVIDTCAPGGGFIFTTDKSLLAPGDVNIETYSDITNFVHEYGKY